MEVMGLAVEIDERPLLLQPCTALDRTRCGMYAYRPGCCRTFECRLLQEVNTGRKNVDEAEEVIRRTRACVARIRGLCAAAHVDDDELSLKERCIEVLSQPTDGGNEKEERLRSELPGAMDELSGLVGEHFL